jgi:hypothetical protein
VLPVSGCSKNSVGDLWLLFHGCLLSRILRHDQNRRIAFLLSAKYDVIMNASEMARSLGQKGGRARARRLSAADKQRIASLGGKARGESLRAARRIADNYRYAAVLGALRGQSPTTRHIRTFSGPLPGIYPARV